MERFNRVLKSSIQLALVQQRSIYDTIIEYIGVYRSTRHAATGETPAFLLHGRNHRTRLPLQGRNTNEPSIPQVEVRQGLPNRVQIYQKKLKQYSDSRRAVKVPPFEPGDFVKIFKSKRKGKMRHKYSTPQEIRERIGPSTYKFDDGTTWNAERLTRTTLQPSKKYSWVLEDDIFPLSPSPLAVNVPGCPPRGDPEVPGSAVSGAQAPGATGFRFAAPDVHGRGPSPPCASPPLAELFVTFLGLPLRLLLHLMVQVLHSLDLGTAALCQTPVRAADQQGPPLWTPRLALRRQ